MRICEPRGISEGAIPYVVYTSPSYNTISQFSTARTNPPGRSVLGFFSSGCLSGQEEEVGKPTYSVRPDLENMSLLVAHLLVKPQDPHNVGPTFPVVCHLLTKKGHAVQVLFRCQNLYSRRGLVLDSIVLKGRWLG
jgi:hypothetical protein